MTDRELERLADLVAERLALAAGLPRVLDAAELAEYLGVSRDVVYANADRLGAIRLGDGERPRLRFILDAEVVRSWRAAPPPAEPEPVVAPPARGRRPGRANAPRVELLPIRGAP